MEPVAIPTIPDSVDATAATPSDPIQTITNPSLLGDVERELAAEPTNSSESTTSPTPNSSPVKYLSPRDSSWLEIDVCREFLRGECTRSAEECRFAHPTGSVIVKEGNKVTCCFDFLKDRCTRETCKYLHPSHAVKDRLVMAGKQYGQVMAMSSKPLLAPPLSPAIQPLPVSGAFPFPYSYLGSPIPTNSIANNTTSYTTPHYYCLRIEICEEFEQELACSRGEHCLFSHPERHVRKNSDNTVTVCWNYLNGYCRHHNCWFFHPSPFQLMAYQLPNRGQVVPQQPPIDNIFLTPYSPDSKVPPSLQPQLSPSMLSPYPFTMVSPPQMMPMSSFPPTFSPAQNFTTLPQTIVS